jgi:hypothetical protein
MARFGNGPGAKRGQGGRPTSAMTTPICSARSARRAAPGAALVLPYAEADTMQLRRNLAQRRRGRPRCSHLRPGRMHTTGKLDMPPTTSRRSSWNPVETAWQYLRQDCLSSTVFENYDAIVDAACMLGESSSLNPKRSRPSECATGLTSVSRYDPWYYAHAYENSEERTAELPRWLHSYNRHCPHGGIGFKAPITRPRTRPEQHVEAPQLASRLTRLQADATSAGAGDSQPARASGRVC